MFNFGDIEELLSGVEDLESLFQMSDKSEAYKEWTFNFHDLEKLYVNNIINKTNSTDWWKFSSMPKIEQTFEDAFVAVYNYPYDLRYVREDLKTYNLCLMAVSKIGTALEFVPEELKTDEMYRAAIQSTGMALKYVTEQTPELCLTAVQKDGQALDYVKQQTLEICIAAVKEDYEALEFVNEELMTHNLFMIAYEQNPEAVKYFEI